MSDEKHQVRHHKHETEDDVLTDLFDKLGEEEDEQERDED